MTDRPINTMSARQIYEELNEDFVGVPRSELHRERGRLLLRAMFDAVMGDFDSDVDTSAARPERPLRGTHEEAWREASMEKIAAQLHLYTNASRRSCYSMAEAITDAIESRVLLHQAERHQE